MDLARLLLALLCAMTTLSSQDPAPGVSRALAKQRAATIGHIGYELHFDLDKGMREVGGRVDIRFNCAEPKKPIVLDFAGSELTNVRFNGKPLAKEHMRRVANHVVITSPNAGSRNWFQAEFKSRVAATGTPLTRYSDKSDGAEYVYTLLVPSDAHELFPCFDQPDLKAIFALTLTTPDDWVAVANEPYMDEPVAKDGRVHHSFRSTAFLPTYLFAFAAGPFAVIEGPRVDFSAQKLPDTEQPVRIFVRAAKKPRVQADLLCKMHLDSIRWYERYFAYDYPFTKIDMVLCPGFPYGGMEHAGAIFYRESALVFDHEPTRVERMRRSSLVYHEVAHQWFGNLVTMTWFDDLWLKEGFATFMGYSVLEALEPESEAWLRFHQRVKPAAYRVDATAGTVPVWQHLENMKDAKSNYGPIVYNKAPAVLRELEHRLGPELFRKGVQVFLQRFALSNASWKDLLASFEMAHAEGLDGWSRKWILDKGMPQVRAAFEVAGGKITSFHITQSSAQGGPASPWPIRVEVLVQNPDGEPRKVAVTCDGAVTAVPELVGAPPPDWVLLNPGDIAYGQFLLDPTSARALPGVLLDPKTRFPDPLVRAVAFRALFEMTRAAELAPERFVEVAVRLLAEERDALTFASLLGAAQTAIDRWLGDERAKSWRTKLEEQLRRQLTGGELAGLELQAFRALARLAASDATLALCREVVAGKTGVPGLKPGKRDRFLAAAALVAAGEKDAVTRLASGTQGDVAKHRYHARAAAADPAVKAEYFASFLEPAEPPEQWVSGCLSFFHWPGQNALTLPYLRKALERVEWVKANRKIFFMPAWIDSFINAHSSRAALDIVEAFLKERVDLDEDVRRKLLQSTDSLRRAVRIKAKRW